MFGKSPEWDMVPSQAIYLFEYHGNIAKVRLHTAGKYKAVTGCSICVLHQALNHYLRKEAEQHFCTLPKLHKKDF